MWTYYVVWIKSVLTSLFQDEQLSKFSIQCYTRELKISGSSKSAITNSMLEINEQLEYKALINQWIWQISNS